MAEPITMTLGALSLASSLAGTGGSIAQASKQNKLRRKAERDATLALASARKELDVNYYDQLSIAKEPYELERDLLAATGAQLTQAGQESERGAEAAAGRVMLQQQRGAAQSRGRMAQEMQRLQELSAAEDANLAMQRANIDLQEVEGAQMAAADAQVLGAQATQQAFSQGAQALGQAAQMAPLYLPNKGARNFSSFQRDFSRMKEAGDLPPSMTMQEYINESSQIRDLGLEDVTGMNDLELEDYMMGVDPSVYDSFITPNAVQSQDYSAALMNAPKVQPMQDSRYSYLDYMDRLGGM